MRSLAAIRRWLWPRTLAGKALVVGAILLLMSGALWTAAFFKTEKQLEEAWAFSDQFGLPKDWDELLGPEIDESRNAAVPFRKAVVLAIEELAGSPEFNANGYSVSPQMALNPERLLNHKAYEEALKEADRRPEYRVLAKQDDWPTYLSYRSIMDSLRLASTEIAIGKWLAERGRVEEGVRRLIRLQRLTRKWSAKETGHWNPLCRGDVEMQTGYALNRILRAHPQLAPAIHDDIENEWSLSNDHVRNCLFAIQAEKLTLLELCETNSYSGGGIVLRPLENLDMLHALDYFNRSMALSKSPIKQAMDDQWRLDEHQKKLSNDRLFKFLHPVCVESLPSLAGLMEQAAGSTAQARCLRIINAMSRRGDFNSSVESLNLPGDCLVDPFDGKRLRVKATPEGPIIYSVGRNMKDDGGEWTKLNDVALRPPPKAVKP